jgi:hypothetical protein
MKRLVSSAVVVVVVDGKFDRRQHHGAITKTPPIVSRRCVRKDNDDDDDDATARLSVCTAVRIFIFVPLSVRALYRKRAKRNDAKRTPTKVREKTLFEGFRMQ